MQGEGSEVSSGGVREGRRKGEYMQGMKTEGRDERQEGEEKN